MSTFVHDKVLIEVESPAPGLRRARIALSRYENKMGVEILIPAKRTSSASDCPLFALCLPSNHAPKLMADSSAPQHSSPDADESSSMPPADWCAEQWSVLCDLLDVSDPREVVPRVRQLGGNANNAPTSSSSGSNQLEQSIQDMQSQLQSLQERNQELLEQLQTDAPSADAAPRSSDTEALFDHLDVSSMHEAEERVKSLTEQLDRLYEEKEQLAQAGLMSADDILDEIDRLQKKCDRLEEETPPASSDASPDALLDVDDAETADTVVTLAEEAHDALTDAGRHLDLDVPSFPSDAAPFPNTMHAIRDAATSLRDGTASVAAGTKIAEVLGLDSPDDARELDALVRRMSDTLETLRADRDTWQDALDVHTAEDLLDLVESMETQLSAVYAQQEDDASFAEEVKEVLGISTVAEARELAEMVHRMDDRLDAAADRPDSLTDVGYDADTALATIESMEKQLVALYEERDADHASSTEDAAPAEADDPHLVQAVTNVLGLTSAEEVERMNETVRRMHDRLDTLQAEHEVLSDADLTAEDAVDMIDNMDEQLSSLYKAQEERSTQLTEQIEQLGSLFGFVPPESPPTEALTHLTDAAESLLSTASHPLPDDEAPDDLAAAIHTLMASDAPSQAADEHDPSAQRELDAIKETLGISSPAEADELATITRRMSDQLDTLQSDHKHLTDAGIRSARSAVAMIESLSEQLDELYEEQELLRNRSAPATEQQDTFQQLAALYAEQEKLERALGLSDADAIIEMVEDLTAQLDDLYSDREASADTPIDLDASSANGTRAHASAPNASNLEEALASLQDQLETLYAEKETLMDLGIANAEEAAEQIEKLEDRLSTVQREREQCHARMEQLQNELGTTSVPKIVSMAKRPSASVPPAEDGPTPTTTSPPTPTRPGNAPSAPPSDADSPPPLLPKETLNQLDAMDEPALDDLSIGVVRLDNAGRIDYLNETARRLPGLDAASTRSDLLGEVLFEVVPSTSNTLFLNRFRKGVEEGELDTRFSYTFLSPHHPPTAFTVHLYRAGASGANWLLFEHVE